MKKGHKLYAYFMEVCQNAKNLYNTTNFYIRQVYTALRTNQPLQPLQQEVLHTLQAHIEIMNENQLHEKRFLKIKDLFHKMSYHIVQLAIQHEISMIVIGKNTSWKQNNDMGKRQNQSFCHIPHNLLIETINYKAKRQGIMVQVVEESYTSKASFLDNDDIPMYGEIGIPVFSGKRIKRG
ncbi:IS200/IS605 family accessory protein TnpB-related protein, partial [Bacillus rhizoplanae]